MAELGREKQIEDNDDQQIIIDVVRGREHELLTNQKIFDKKTLMYPAYQAALHALEGIIKSTDRWYDTKREDDSRCCKDSGKSVELYGFANNVIAFCGGRGHGKTSAMMSFSAALGDRNCDMSREERKKQRELLARWTGGKVSFHILPPIDPTMLGDGAAVSDLILAKLFTEISNAWNADECCRGKLDRNNTLNNEEKKYHVLRLLRQCQEGIGNKDRKGTDGHGQDFERFVQSVDVFSFKKNLHEIVRYLLEALGYNGKNDFLVIQLDDTDMQLTKAHETMEVVRRYLSIPNVVVLMATDLTQLRRLVNVHYRKSIDIKCHDSEKGLGFNYEYMAAKYIDKLIPVSHAIYLPTLTAQYMSGKKIAFQLHEREGHSIIDLEEYLFGEIYRKTGLVFISHQRRVHELLPSSLRGIMHLLRLINQMDDPKEEAAGSQREDADDVSPPNVNYDRRIKETRQKLQNLSQFEDYFVNDWFASKVEAASSNSDALPLMDMREISSENLIAYYYDWARKRRGDDNENHAYEKLINCLYELVRDCRSAHNYNLYFSVCTFLSIQLNKCALADELWSLERLMNEQEKRGQKVLLEYGNLRKVVLLPDVAEPKTPNELFQAALVSLSTFHDKKDLLRVYDILICFADKLARDNVERLKTQEKIFILQENLVTVFFNWDILRQFWKYVEIEPHDESKPFAILSEGFEKIIDLVKEKSAPIIRGRMGDADKDFKNLFGSLDVSREEGALSKDDRAKNKAEQELKGEIDSIKRETDHAFQPDYLQKRPTTRKNRYVKIENMIDDSSFPNDLKEEWKQILELAIKAAGNNDLDTELKLITSLREAITQYIRKSKGSKDSPTNDDADK